MLKRRASEESEGGGASVSVGTWLGSGGVDIDRTVNAATKRRAIAKTNRVGRESSLGIRNVFRRCGLRFVFRWLCCPTTDAELIVRGAFDIVKCFDVCSCFSETVCGTRRDGAPIVVYDLHWTLDD